MWNYIERSQSQLSMLQEFLRMLFCISGFKLMLYLSQSVSSLTFVLMFYDGCACILLGDIFKETRKTEVLTLK
jgi:hypothetical protein